MDVIGAGWLPRQWGISPAIARNSHARPSSPLCPPIWWINLCSPLGWWMLTAPCPAIMRYRGRASSPSGPLRDSVRCQSDVGRVSAQASLKPSTRSESGCEEVDQESDFGREVFAIAVDSVNAQLHRAVVGQQFDE